MNEGRKEGRKDAVAAKGMTMTEYYLMMFDCV